MDKGGSQSEESDISIDIKVQSEVEKIWIMYDLDNNGVLDIEEVTRYLNDRCPHIPKNMMQVTFDKMDLNKNG
eukprot:CAMPEP_0168612674 /NCGR_PEP_ID=MMETSP0449_2-20121227/3043_1 /TAXON_ID=1082188 /ORGANISM="Strombidium rassoulzadegani, Strain ras09" /LENGTH=72 /DNA_ID=CAMNT_0008653255 /DNA_START=14 /DNA_END=232 /DNA_ORIENTATION=-